MFHSRKFWLMALDIIISTAVYFLTRYVAPDLAEDIIWLIFSWQPVIVALIAGIAIEDAGEKASGSHVTQK